MYNYSASQPDLKEVPLLGCIMVLQDVPSRLEFAYRTYLHNICNLVDCKRKTRSLFIAKSSHLDSYSTFKRHRKCQAKRCTSPRLNLGMEKKKKFKEKNKTKAISGEIITLKDKSRDEGRNKSRGSGAINIKDFQMLGKTQI